MNAFVLMHKNYIKKIYPMRKTKSHSIYDCQHFKQLFFFLTLSETLFNIFVCYEKFDNNFKYDI